MICVMAKIILVMRNATGRTAAANQINPAAVTVVVIKLATPIMEYNVDNIAYESLVVRAQILVIMLPRLIVIPSRQLMARIKSGALLFSPRARPKAATAYAISSDSFDTR